MSRRSKKFRGPRKPILEAKVEPDGHWQMERVKALAPLDDQIKMFALT
jgi:hypothetical protein